MVESQGEKIDPASRDTNIPSVNEVQAITKSSLASMEYKGMGNVSSPPIAFIRTSPSPFIELYVRWGYRLSKRTNDPSDVLRFKLTPGVRDTKDTRRLSLLARADGNRITKNNIY